MRSNLLRQSRFIVLGARHGEDVALRNKSSRRLPPECRRRTVYIGFGEGLAGHPSATIILMPSTGSEGFGLAALEAISEGVPVLISAASGLADALTLSIPEIARPHIVDVMSPSEFEKGVRRVFDDPDEAFRSAQTRYSDDHFSWDDPQLATSTC